MPIQTLLPYDINERNAARQGAAALNEQLDRIIQNRVQQMQKDQQRQDLKAAGYSDTDIGIIQQIPQNDLFKFLTGFKPEQPSQSPNMQNTLAQGLQGQQPQLPETLGALAGQPQDMIQRALGKTPLQQPAAPQMMQGGPQMQAPIAQSQTTAQRLASSNFESPDMRLRRELHAEDISERRRGNDIQERTNNYKINKKQIDALHDESVQAEKDIHTLKQIKSYNSTGKLIQGPLRDILEKFGMENLFTNEPTQVTAKLIAGMSTGVAEAYGATPRSNLFLKTYQETLPRMINDKNGLATIAENKILEREAVPIINKELRKLEHKYNKEKEPYPLDIIELARENAKPETDKLLAKSEQNIRDFIKRDNADIIKQLPPASKSKDDPKINAERGIVAESDGKTWTIRLATPEELAGEGAR